jgi:hypothetical protein
VPPSYIRACESAARPAIKFCSCLIVAMLLSAATVFAFPQAPSTATQPPITTSAPTPKPDAVPHAPTGSPSDTPSNASSPRNQPSQTDPFQSHPQNDPVILLYMPDGQLKSHTIAVYVTHNLQEEQRPQLQLLRSHAVTNKEENEDVKLSPILVAPNQEWSQSENNQQIRRTGTLLLFDVASADFFPKPMIRVRPVVYWTEGGQREKVIGKDEVNVGDVVAASLWTVLFTFAALSLIIFLASRGRKTIGATRVSLIQFLAAADGHLSLGQTQIACWTVVVGSVVLGYGLIRLEIPTIPASLLALMGASLVTGGVAYFQDSQNQRAAATVPIVPAAAVPPPAAAAAPLVAPPPAVAAPVADVPAADDEQVGKKIVPQLSDLVNNFAVGKAQGQLSLAKAQMIFWTILLLALFLSKSILEGAIWDIPWALVALMGFSQAGYLAPKIAPSP